MHDKCVHAVRFHFWYIVTTLPNKANTTPLSTHPTCKEQLQNGIRTEVPVLQVLDPVLMMTSESAMELGEDDILLVQSEDEYVSRPLVC